MNVSLQDQYAPGGVCFGCGPTNRHGLRIKSFVRGDVVVAEFRPSNHHHGFPEMLSGGVIGTLFDCHMNWTAAWHLMIASGLHTPPCTVTGRFGVSFVEPTPMDRTLRIESRVVELGPRKAEVIAELFDRDTNTAKGNGVFISVKQGHPAYDRWNAIDHASAVTASKTHGDDSVAPAENGDAE